MDLSNYVELEAPTAVSRAIGDVHPKGNPHFSLDPHNIPILARAIKDRMCQLDQENCSFYTSNLEDFLERWTQKMSKWDMDFSKLKGTRIVQYHKTYSYLFKRYGLEEVGTLEPLPGIPPTPKHLDELVQRAKGAKLVVYEVFRNSKPAKRVANAIGAKAVVLPHDVGVEGVKDIFDLFDEILRRLSH